MNFRKPAQQVRTSRFIVISNELTQSQPPQQEMVQVGRSPPLTRANSAAS